MQISILLMSICAIILSYYGSGVISVLVMERFGYDLSIAAMVNYVRRAAGYDRGELNEQIGRQGIAINLQVRIVLTLMIYALISLIVLVMATSTHDRGLITVGYVAFSGILLNGIAGIIVECRYWPQILEYQGLDKEKHDMHLKKIYLDEGDEPGTEMVLGTDDMSAGLFDEGDIVVMLVPPVGDIIYDLLI
jgi:hypothetical protein